MLSEEAQKGVPFEAFERMLKENPEDVQEMADALANAGRGAEAAEAYGRGPGPTAGVGPETARGPTPIGPRSMPLPPKRDSASESMEGAQKSGKGAPSKTPGSPNQQPGNGSESDKALAMQGSAAQGGSQAGTTGSPNPDAMGANPQADPQAYTVPEEVPLQATQFKGEAKMRAEIEQGAALVPYSEAQAQGKAATQGAEHGTYPLRYRSYVRRYFEQSQKAQRK